MGAQFVGGPNNVEPGESVTAIVHFDEGAHGVACFIPDDKDGKPHAEHGMVGRVNVVKTADSVEDAPKVDGGSISLSEFTFLPDVKAFLLTPPGSPAAAGPPPFTTAGGIVGLGPNQTMYQTMSLSPGKYVFVCFFPDPTKGDLPHAVEGMLKEFTIS